jgi:hypothetical protein
VPYAAHYHMYDIMATVLLALGGAATSPVFLACAVSYTTVTSAGMIHDLVRGKPAQELDENEAKVLGGDKGARGGGDKGACGGQQGCHLMIL